MTPYYKKISLAWVLKPVCPFLPYKAVLLWKLFKFLDREDTQPPNILALNLNFI